MIYTLNNVGIKCHNKNGFNISSNKKFMNSRNQTVTTVLCTINLNQFLGEARTVAPSVHWTALTNKNTGTRIVITEMACCFGGGRNRGMTCTHGDIRFRRVTLSRVDREAFRVHTADRRFKPVFRRILYCTRGDSVHRPRRTRRGGGGGKWANAGRPLKSN